MTNKLVSFEDLIIDIMVLPNGKYYILDQDELPIALDQFENGSVLQTLNSLTASIDIHLSQTVLETERTYNHKELFAWLNGKRPIE